MELLATSAGYVRNAFVLCCFDEHSEFEHLENILNDAISDSSISTTKNLREPASTDKKAIYEKYYIADYKPVQHEYREDDTEGN